LSQGVDEAVKTIYSPPPLLIEQLFPLRKTIVKSAHIVRTNRPVKGLVAFVRAFQMPSFGACADAHLATGYRLDRDEEKNQPGEGSA
jgi:hypothetical protein